MATVDLAKRVYDHTWKLDPIIRSLLDTQSKIKLLEVVGHLTRAGAVRRRARDERRHEGRRHHRQRRGHRRPCVTRGDRHRLRRLDGRGVNQEARGRRARLEPRRHLFDSGL